MVALRLEGLSRLARLSLAGVGLAYTLYFLLSAAPPPLLLAAAIALGLRVSFSLLLTRPLLTLAVIIELAMLLLSPIPLLVAALLAPTTIISYIGARPVVLLAQLSRSLRRGGRESVSRETEVSGLVLLHHLGLLMVSAIAVDLLIATLGLLVEVPRVGVGVLFTLMAMLLGVGGLLLRVRRGVR